LRHPCDYKRYHIYMGCIQFVKRKGIVYLLINRVYTIYWLGININSYNQYGFNRYHENVGNFEAYVTRLKWLNQGDKAHIKCIFFYNELVFLCWVWYVLLLQFMNNYSTDQQTMSKNIMYIYYWIMYYFAIFYVNIILVALRLIYHYCCIVKERYLRCVTTNIIKVRLSPAFGIFLIIEFIVFRSLFWTYFHFSLTEIWPPLGISKCNPYGLPLLNTCLLLRSALSLTVYHNYVVIGSITTLKEKYLGRTILLGGIFIYIQYAEYKYHLVFRLSDGVYGSIFYSLTGFHGSHVLIGIVFLSTVFLSLDKYALCKSHLGVTAAIWYWHFVDIIWIFLFLFVYIY